MHKDELALTDGLYGALQKGLVASSDSLPEDPEEQAVDSQLPLMVDPVSGLADPPASAYEQWGDLSNDKWKNGGAIGKTSSKHGTYAPYKACYHSHPVLKLGGGMVVGGRCGEPKEGADVYIGFDHGMAINPWVPGTKPPTQIFYPITDMQAPSNYKTFQELIDLCVIYLAEGKTIHCGCIGGHGRTGTFLAALVRATTNELDAITWVRKNYCEKAVESNGQIEFLHKHFGITKVKPSKGSYSAPKSKGTSYWPKAGGSEIKTKKGVAFSNAEKTYSPVPSDKLVISQGCL